MKQTDLVFPRRSASLRDGGVLNHFEKLVHRRQVAGVCAAVEPEDFSPASHKCGSWELKDVAVLLKRASQTDRTPPGFGFLPPSAKVVGGKQDILPHSSDGNSWRGSSASPGRGCSNPPGRGGRKSVLLPASSRILNHSPQVLPVLVCTAASLISPAVFVPVGVLMICLSSLTSAEKGMGRYPSVADWLADMFSWRKSRYCFPGNSMATARVRHLNVDRSLRTATNSPFHEPWA